MVELGVLGFFAFMLMATSLLYSVVRMIVKSLDPRQKYFPLYVGIASIFIANAGSFVVSHQVYGDPFIIIWLSFLLGILLASARTVSAEAYTKTHRVPGDRIAGAIKGRPATTN